MPVICEHPPLNLNSFAASPPHEEGLGGENTVTLQLPGSGHVTTVFPPRASLATARTILDRLSQLAPTHVNPIRRMFRTGEFIAISLAGETDQFINLTLQDNTLFRNIGLRLEEGYLTISFEHIRGSPSVETLNALAREVEDRFCYYRLLNRVSGIFRCCARKTAIE